jgi:hypothetical protein
MRHPLEALQGAARRRTFLALLALDLVLAGALGAVDRSLRTEGAPSGIVSFELAGSSSSARRVVESWDADARVQAGFSLGLDYLFLVVYSTTIALACLWVADTLRPRHGRAASLGVWLAWGQWAAAALDAVENAALLATLLGPTDRPWPELARACALPKFALVLTGLTFTALGGALAAIRLLHASADRRAS